MKRRGANLASSVGAALSESERFSFEEVGALGRPIVAVAQQLLRKGLTSAELCSLLTQTAAMLAQQEDGLDGREEWLALASELFDAQANDGESDRAITAPGGEA